MVSQLNGLPQRIITAPAAKEVAPQPVPDSAIPSMSDEQLQITVLDQLLITERQRTGHLLAENVKLINLLQWLKAGKYKLDDLKIDGMSWAIDRKALTTVISGVEPAPADQRATVNGDGMP